MRVKKKICVVTGSRADYGLLTPLIEEIPKEKSFQMQIIATGMHLSPEFGLTYKAIETDGIKIDEKIEMLLSSDTSVGVCKAMGLAMISFSEVFQRLKPDLIIGLGDRFELLSAVAAANVARIPVAHIHGGELTEGAFDEGFRHSITKMSHLHFTTTDTYRKRVIQLGENPKYVYNTGAIGLDNIRKLKLLSRIETERSLDFKLDMPYFVVTYHPVTLENKTSEYQFGELLSALDNFKTHKVIFTYPNADSDGRIIIKLINEYVTEHSDKARAFDSLGQIRYLSVLKQSALMIGNSSSGIIEMPFFRKPTVNIGDRQKGRLFSESVIQSGTSKRSITASIRKGLSIEFNRRCERQKQIHGRGYAAEKIVKVIKGTDLRNIIKKRFYSLPITLK